MIRHFCFAVKPRPAFVFFAMISALYCNSKWAEASSQSAGSEKKLNSSNLELHQWLSDQEVRAETRLMDAVRQSPGMEGSIRAATSAHYEPSTWVRDGQRVAISMLRRLRLYKASNTEPEKAAKLFKLLSDYATFQMRLQRTPNLCGAALDKGVGEPKFNKDGSAFLEEWGRWQTDGPALRAIFAMEFADFAKSRPEAIYRDLSHSWYKSESPATSFLKVDLEFSGKYWHHHSFDPWEEVNAHHFYNRYLQYVALSKGSEYASYRGDHGAADFYRKQAKALQEDMHSAFWDIDRKRFRCHFDRSGGVDYKTSKLDISIVLALLHGHEDPRQTHSAFLFLSDEMLSTVWQLEDAMEKAYAINARKTDSNGFPLAPAIGRYVEDRFNGYVTDSTGNPWFLATHAMAEYYAILGSKLLNEKAIVINDLNKPFYERLLGKELKGEHHVFSSPHEKEKLAKACMERTYDYLNRSREHTERVTGAQSEQINRDTGYMTGSELLTWNEESFLSANRALEILKTELSL